MTYRILKIEDRPERDPYRNDGSASVTTLNIDPQDRTVWVTQDYRTNSTPISYWLGHRYAVPITGHPNTERIRAWLESDPAQRDLEELAVGHSIEWDGINHVGLLTEDASDVLDSLHGTLSVAFDGYADNWQYWDIHEWIAYEYMRDNIEASTTDEELARMAENLEREAESEKIVLSGPVIDTLRYYRDTQ